MASWVGPTVAIAVSLIALCVLAAAVVAVSLVREARAKTESLAHELADLRSDIAPTLAAINRFSEAGGDLVDRVGAEVDAVLDTSRDVRRRLTAGVRGIENRLADLDALLEVATEEADAALVDASHALQTLRSGAGLLSHVGRLLVATDPDDEPEDDLDAADEIDEEDLVDEDADEVGA
jgi:hypothetical protein